MDARDDLEIGCAHGLCGLDHAVADLLDRGFDHARDIGRGSDDEHDDHGLVAHARADDGLGDRQHCDHQDDEGNRAEDVHDEAEHAVD